MPHDPVKLYMLLLKKDIHAKLYRTERGVNIRTHEVCEREAAVWTTDKQRPAFIEMRDTFTGEIAVRQKSAAVLITLQCVRIQLPEELAHVNCHAEELCEFLKDIDPGVQIRGTIVCMRHRNRIAVRCGHHVDLTVQLRKLLFENHHREGRGAGRNIAGTGCYGICRSHTGACITLRRAERDAGLKSPCRIQKLRTLLRQLTSSITSYEYLRENIAQAERYSSLFKQCIELRHHVLIIVQRL